MGRVHNRTKAMKEYLATHPHRCENCGSTIALSVHHVVPLSNGGTDTVGNMKLLCGLCHDRCHFNEVGVISHAEAVKAGVMRAKANGVRLGKKPADYDGIMKLIAEHSTQFHANVEDGWPEWQIRKDAGVSLTTYCKVKGMLMEDMAKDTWEHDFPKPVVYRDYPSARGKQRGVRNC